jgi:hypothetical protein
MFLRTGGEMSVADSVAVRWRDRSGGRAGRHLMAMLNWTMSSSAASHIAVIDAVIKARKLLPGRER